MIVNGNCDTVPSTGASASLIQQQQRRNSHKGCVLWLTGLSGSGKSTLSRGVQNGLLCRGFQSFLLDGDDLRSGLNSDLTFSPEDRSENIRRTAEVARLFALSGQVAITALISPYQKDREIARTIVLASNCDFFEVFVDAPLAICEARDPKGLYRQARAGNIRQFTGIDAPYEAPKSPEIHVHTFETSIQDCVASILLYILQRVEISLEQTVGADPRLLSARIGEIGLR